MGPPTWIWSLDPIRDSRCLAQNIERGKSFTVQPFTFCPFFFVINIHHDQECRKANQKEGAQGYRLARASTKTSQASMQRLLELLIMRELVTLDGATSSDNCVNTRHSLVTAACQASILPTPSSGNEAHSIREEHRRKLKVYYS